MTAQPNDPREWERTWSTASDISPTYPRDGRETICAHERFARTDTVRAFLDVLRFVESARERGITNWRQTLFLSTVASPADRRDRAACSTDKPVRRGNALRNGISLECDTDISVQSSSAGCEANCP